MKKILFAISFCVFLLMLLNNCKREGPAKKTVTQNNDPDSLYQGTPYTLAVPSTFPTVAPNMLAYSDSMTVEGVALGRRLFYDKHLSLDGHKSCASCHKLATALTDAGFVKSINEFGPTVRNTPAIQNLAFAPYLFWDGRQPTLMAQAQDAAQHELGLIAVNFISYLQSDTTYVKLFKKAFGRPGTITEDKIFNAIQQFGMTAISANSKFDRFRAGTEQLDSAEAVGYNLFLTETGDCFHCHMSQGGLTLLMTDNLFRNNGLDSALSISDFKDPGRGAITGNSSDYGKFRDPSLRNIALTSPYMHDGRYQTLMQVVSFYSDSTKLSPTIDPILLLPNHNYGRGLHLSLDQKQALVTFLSTLTDTTFIHNPNLSDPFKE